MLRRGACRVVLEKDDALLRRLQRELAVRRRVDALGAVGLVRRRAGGSRRPSAKYSRKSRKAAVWTCDSEMLPDATAAGRKCA